MNRALGKKCPEDYIQNGHRFEVIPATQRTNNLPGFALDITPWTTESQIWIKMQAYTPRLPVNSVFEMYASVLDRYETTRILYDTV